jgi:hypothetical protein
MPTQKELLDRIRDLEEQNSALQDKLDMIYSILAPDYEDGEQEGEEDDSEPAGSPGLVQIDDARQPRRH